MIELRPISILSDNMKECIELEVTLEQAKFVAHNATSLGQAYSVNGPGGLGSRAIPYTIHADGKMVGFIMYGFFKPEFDDDYGEGKDYYYFWRFMVDKSQQGKGYGKIALTKLMEEIKTKPCGDAEHVYVSYYPNNPIQKLYHSLGFEETGKELYGEKIAKMKI
ncbi:MAG: GNAT family N-acetyltransferase [Defluviitaleaceae bacterium]|nr:GNAT family N-acetyltransferase [Defluviitaleaceae bacterium]